MCTDICTIVALLAATLALGVPRGERPTPRDMGRQLLLVVLVFAIGFALLLLQDVAWRQSVPPY